MKSIALAAVAVVALSFSAATAEAGGPYHHQVRRGAVHGARGSLYYRSNPVVRHRYGVAPVAPIYRQRGFYPAPFVNPYLYRQPVPRQGLYIGNGGLYIGW